MTPERDPVMSLVVSTSGNVIDLSRGPLRNGQVTDTVF